VDKVLINDPKHWRERAEEARTVADDMTGLDSGFRPTPTKKLIGLPPVGAFHHRRANSCLQPT
jgi:hypothetical protein